MSTQLVTLHQQSQGMATGMLRLAAQISSGAFVTLAIFWLMSELVASDGKPQEPPAPLVFVDPVFRESDTEIDFRKSLPEPPKPMEKPPQQMPDMEDLSQDDGMDGFNPGFDVAAPNVATDAVTDLTMGGGGDARPIVRISPRYPIAAARDGVEGWVRLSFTINETGGVEDVVVIDAEPARVFNREAMRALKKWKYKPKEEDGRAVKQTGIVVELTFSLDGNEAQ